MEPPLPAALSWYLAERADPLPEICSSRDQFQARLDSFYQDLVQTYHWSSEEVALLTAAVGEIGNNCFDHNLGKWRDLPGCFFAWSLQKENLLVAAIVDRGQGVLGSLRRILPDLRTEGEALRVAFEKRISGRSPEQRGNGLKFVRSIFNESNSRGLVFASGNTAVRFGRLPRLENHPIVAPLRSKKGTGTLALILWKLP